MTTPPPPPESPMGDTPSNSGALLRPQSDDEKTMAMLAHLLNIFALLLGPLIIFVAKKDSAYVQQESKEALNFGITILIAGTLTCGIGYLVGLVFFIIGTISASKGEPYRYPFNWRIVK